MTVSPFKSAHARELGTLLGLVILCVVIWILSPFFLTWSNLLNILQQTSINAIIAVGMTFVILTAGIDLSVGAILAFAGVVAAQVMHAEWPMAAALLTGLLAGVFCGGLNGFLITFGKLPPFIATLGLMSIARGATLLFTEGRPLSGFSAGFRALATSELFYVPTPVWIMLLVYGLAHFMLTQTRHGRYVYAMGGNEEAARLSGINIRLHKTAVYAWSGLTSALAALLLTARLNSAQPIAGLMYELDAIAATVIGGTSLLGGEGTLLGTLLGALLMGVLRNGLNLLGVSSFLQQVIIGSVIILAVWLDVGLRARRRS
ncbi:ribose ABC transporter permease [candidate division KSB1 bacterium]|nr:ribose ABC transporter permease [candidate division KSB1 bacterium]